MALRQTKKLETDELLIHDSTVQNPYAASPDAGTIENFIPTYGKLLRATYAPPFEASSAASKVWNIIDFHFVRNNAREQQLLIFKANGKVYRRSACTELEVYPAFTAFAAFSNKPAVVQIADRLHVSDGALYMIYDGWNWVQAGLTAPAAAPTTALVAGALTGNYKLAVSAVHILNGVRVHEGNRSPITGFLAPAAQNIRVTMPGDLPTRATHWSVYISELSNSDILRRSVTVPITSGTTDISTEPSPTAPTAPIRNDSVQPSRVLAGWKNRLAMRSEVHPDQLWFTAFGEVKGLLNGACEECLPGRSDTSISDIVNSWTLPQEGEPVMAAIWHDELLFAFSDRTGYFIKGEGTLLDNRSLRDFYPVQQFTFGAASPGSVCSTPFGLVVFTPENKLWLWNGKQEVFNIGLDIQSRLDAINPTEAADIQLSYWSSGSSTWLFMPLLDRIQIFDFSTTTEDSPLGIWFSIGTQGGLPQPTATGQYNPGLPFMLSGHIDGSVHQIDAVSPQVNAQPTHVGLSFVLGETYVGATPQNSPTCLARSAAIAPEETTWSVGHYVEIYQCGQNDTDTTGIRTSNPTVTIYYDRISPNNATGGVVLTLNTVPGSLERRGWLKPTAGASAVGTLARRFQIEVGWPAGVDTDGQARAQCVNNEVRKLSFAHQPRHELSK